MAKFMPSSAFRWRAGSCAAVSWPASLPVGSAPVGLVGALAARSGSLNQGLRHPKRQSQFGFFARHCTIIALVVKARQMENSVERQNLDFLGNGMSETYGILARNVGRDGNVAGQLSFFAMPCWGSIRKRQNVGSFVVAAKLAVQTAYNRAAGDEHVDRGAEAHRLSRPQDKARHRAFVQPRDFFLQNNQVFVQPIHSLRSERVTHAQKQTGGPNRGPPAQSVRLYPSASAEVALCSLAPVSCAAASCVAAVFFSLGRSASAFLISALLGSASKSICCSATRLCSS